MSADEEFEGEPFENEIVSGQEIVIGKMAENDVWCAFGYDSLGRLRYAYNPERGASRYKVTSRLELAANRGTGISG